ncbi:MAG: SLBB domain-containing protein [Muribaculaceae bacterium]|nr:SLBB domain-containing protein [Muribaculaceae bacterium]
MTDDEVIRYIRTQSANGKTEQQIGQELMAKGVTPAQVKRIKSKYSKEGTSAIGTPAPAQSAAIIDNGRDAAPEMAVAETDIVVDVNDPSAKETAREVYGHDLFNSRSLTFEPNKNLATPMNYRLGPGDEVIIDVWGAAEEHLREKISPEGSIMISRLGPVYLNGKTIDEANKYVRNLFARKYAGVINDQTDISVNLGDVRSISVDIMGEVSKPGSFQLSPFSTVFHALYNAGGINNIGSMRNISVLRNGKRVATVDIYDYLFNGKQTGNIKLQEGDVIIVPPYEQIVNISGNVKRPMYYEIKPGETVASLLDYSGGLSGDAYSGMVRLSRQNGEENELYNISKDEFSSYKLKDGDVVTVGTVLDRFTNRVELKGAVMRPGLYALGSKTTTLGDLIRMADGLTEDAYKGRALLYRQGPDLTLEVIPFDLAGLIDGTSHDIVLQKNDIIEIASVQTMEERGDFYISGMVTQPGSYSYAANTSVEDLILRAGGLREGASTARVDISRRIVHPADTFQTQQLAQIFTVEITGGLAHKNNSAKEFILKPYDRVVVRSAPGYMAQKEVSVDGMVLFPGAYTLQKRNERLSEVVERTGGILDGAYLKGAYLKRRLSDDERQARENALRLAMQNQEGTDSISKSKIIVSDVYNVGINLPMALANPGSEYDLVLQENDHLFIPEFQSTVKVSGDVMYPNTVIYEPKQKVSYYINQAGGYGNTAKKNKCYIVYMNGQVAKVGRKTVVEPGSQIIVPSKEISNNTSWEKILTFVSGFGSVATMAATVASLFRR